MKRPLLIVVAVVFAMLLLVVGYLGGRHQGMPNHAGASTQAVSSGSVDKVPMSARTALGCQNAPIIFLPSG